MEILMIGLASRKDVKSETRRPTKQKRWHRRDISLYLLALPGVLFFLVFSYAPMFGVIVAFKKFNISQGIWNSAWNGFQNFTFLFTSNQLPHVLFNTLFLNTLFIIATTSFSIALAIFFNEIHIRTFKRVVQSTILLPYFMSWVVISMMVQAILNGIGGQPALLNSWLALIGIKGVDWFLTPAVWPTVLTVLNVWQGAGYLSIIYLAAITSIPDEVYEAACIDGASRAQMALRVTLPLLVPTIMILLLLSIGRIFYGNFGMIYAIVGDNGQLFSTTDVIDTYVFRALRINGDLGTTAAAGLFQSVAGFILVVAANWISRRYSDDNALF
jgi:putative aldouronate transport system permease protein